MTDHSLEEQIRNLRDLLVANVGEPERLYSLFLDFGDASGNPGIVENQDHESEDSEDEFPKRILCPRLPVETLLEAERTLGFSLPPLLRGVYTRIGNGGLCLRLLGLEGGSVGSDLFPGMTAMEIYQEMDRWRQDGQIPYLPPFLLAINDDLGCGMVDFVDCRTAGGKIWRSDSGTVYEQQPTLLAYLQEAINAFGTFARRSQFA